MALNCDRHEWVSDIQNAKFSLYALAASIFVAIWANQARSPGSVKQAKATLGFDSGLKLKNGFILGRLRDREATDHQRSTDIRQ